MRKLRLVQILVLLFLAAMACSGNVDTASPTGTRVTAVESATAETSRESTISYLRTLTSISADYEQSLADAGIKVELSHSDGQRRIRVNGQVDLLARITEGFSARLSRLEPPQQSQEMKDVQELAVRILDSELRWMDQYRSSVNADNPARIRDLETDYVMRLPLTDIREINRVITESLAARNIPFGRLGLQVDDFRLTILDEDFVRPLQEQLAEAK